MIDKDLLHYRNLLFLKARLNKKKVENNYIKNIEVIETGQKTIFLPSNDLKKGDNEMEPKIYIYMYE